MSSAGVLTFTAGGAQRPPLTPPSIVSVTRVGTATTISVASTNGVNYRLRYADSSNLGLNVTDWPFLPSVPGNYPTTSLQDTAPDATRFYRVEAFY